MKLVVIVLLALATGCLVVPTKTTTYALRESERSSDTGPLGGATLRIQTTPEGLVIAAARARTCITEWRRTYDVTDHWGAELSTDRAVHSSSDLGGALFAVMTGWVSLPVSGIITGIYDAAANGHKHVERVVEADGERPCPLATPNVSVSVVVGAEPAIRGSTDADGRFVLPLPQSSGVVEVSTPESSSFINYVAPDEIDELVAVRKIIRSCGMQRRARGTVRIATKDEAILVDTRDAKLATCISNGVTGLRHAVDHPIELAFSYRF